MTKQTGLGANFYASGNQISNDTSQVNKIAGPMSPIDVTGIDKSAHERLGGHRSGEISWTSFFNPTVAHPVLSALPTADALTTFAVPLGAPPLAIGAPCASHVCKQLDYDPQRGTDGSLLFSVDSLSNGYGLEWGDALTPGVRTDTAATNGASFDGGGGFTTPAVPASTVAVQNTSLLTATVVISGGTMTNVSVNGVTVGAGAGTYTVPFGQSITMTYTVAPTWTWTLATAFGLQAYLHVFAITGTDVTIKLQDSADNATFADLAGGAFTQVTSAPGWQRIALSNTATVRRYLRVATTTVGGFTNAAFFVQATRNETAGQVF